MVTDNGAVFIDTNVLIYATLEADPRFERSRSLLEDAAPYERYISVQNLAEMYPNLTGPKTIPPDDPSSARSKIWSIASLSTIEVLPVSEEVIKLALELCETYAIARQRYFDAQILATMIAYGIRTLYTENTRDFECFPQIRATNPFGDIGN